MKRSTLFPLRTLRFIAILLLVPGVLPLPSCSPSGDILRGRVVEVADGDSFTLLDEGTNCHRIRLYGIDAPERTQPFSRKAKEALDGLIAGKTIEIQRMDKDRYGRIVGIARVGGINVNEVLLRDGWAWHFTRFDQNPDWANLEREARQARRGLWAEEQPLPPWEFRRKKAKAAP